MSRKGSHGLIHDRRVYPLPENNDVSPWITDICVLPNGGIVLADFNGQRLIHLSKYYEHICSLSLSGSPWGVDEADSDYAVATMSAATKLIHVIKLGHDKGMKVVNTIRTKFVCNGIVYCGGTFVVTCPESASVKMLDIHGNVKWSVTKYGCRHSKSFYFHEPKYVCANADKSRFIVTDTRIDIIVSIARDGSVLNLITVPTGSPMGLSLGRNGKVYVCMNGLNAIHEYNDGLTQERAVGTRTDGVRLPQAICYNPEKHELTVSSAIEKYLATYQFSK